MAREAPDQSKLKKTTDSRRLDAAVYSLNGERVGSVSLPEKMWGVSDHVSLISQSVRVHQDRQHSGSRKVKTRADVVGSTKKIYRQKGTGRARHGDRNAPLFIGGGRAHGPQGEDRVLRFPLKMRRKALYSALSQKLREGHVTIVSGVETIQPKTRAMLSLLRALPFGQVLFDKRPPILFLVSGQDVHAFRAGRNIPYLMIRPAWNVSAYDVAVCRHVLISRTALPHTETSSSDPIIIHAADDVPASRSPRKTRVLRKKTEHLPKENRS